MNIFDTARKNMITNQLRTNRISNPRIISAFGEVPREIFVGEHFKHIAYTDEAVPVSKERFLLPPMIFAKMLELSAINENSTVLDIGCGSGYSTSVIAKIVKKVVALESEPKLASMANANLQSLKIDNVVIITGELSDGFRDGAPYDAIFINGSISSIPKHLQSQLSENGVIVAPVIETEVTGKVLLQKRLNNNIIEMELFESTVPVLEDFKVVGL